MSVSGPQRGEGGPHQPCVLPLPPAVCPTISRLCRSTNKILKAELVYRETFGATRKLQVKLADNYVHWYNNFRIHSTLGYMTPVEFRKAGLVLPRSSKKM